MIDVKKLLKKNWVFYGRWKEKPLDISYWILNQKPKNKAYNKYRVFDTDHIYLDGY